MSAGDSYMKKPEIVRAVKFDGTPESLSEIKNFGVFFKFKFKNRWIWSNTPDYSCEIINSLSYPMQSIEIATNDGIKILVRGDWIIKDINNKISGCDANVFEKTYEEV